VGSNPTGVTKGKENMSNTIGDITFFRNNNSFLLGVDRPTQRYSVLPTGTYLLKFSMDTGYYLDIVDDFQMPKKIYGNLEKKAAKILNTFAERPTTTGVHLCGEKGSGKTLLTKLISNLGQEVNIPTIIINIPAHGDDFNAFIAKIKQSAILLFDEFEKVYDGDAQKGLLTLLDGVFASKKLFLLTSNDYAQVNELMKNRPGRVYYHLDFAGLDPQFIKEYGQDNLKNKAFLENLIVLAGFLKPLNFDMLKAIIEESNRYNESPIDTLDMLNVKVTSWRDYFLFELIHPTRKVPLKDEDGTPYSIYVNPLTPFSVNYQYKTLKGKASSDYASFEPNELVSADGLEGIYEFRKKNGIYLKLIRKPVVETGIKKYSKVLDGLEDKESKE
jgi:hypothetical protein